MKIVAVTSDKEKQDFINFPFKLYRGSKDANWVPSLKSDVEFNLDRSRHPFYEDARSDAQPFIVKRDGEVVGRILAIECETYNEEHDTNTAFFYLFESVNQESVAQALFDAAFEWSRERGMNRIIGPMGLLAGDGHGVLVEGFENRPGMGMPWNPPYYEDLVSSAGFEKEADTYSAELTLDYNKHREIIENLYDSAAKVKNKRGFKTKSFASKGEIKDNMSFLVPELTNVYNKSFGELPFYHPMDEKKMKRIIDRLLSLVDGNSVDLVQFVMKGESLVGFLLVYPNIVSGLRKAGGTIWPLGWLHIGLNRRFTTWADANGIGILPRFQGSGATVLLYAELIRTLQKSRFEHLIINQVLEENHKNLREMEIFGVTDFDRVHRIYRRDL